jgi:hypothetical protein
VRLKQSFTIHPVGQGLFYSCTLSRLEKVTFRMVFDCGSKTAGAGQEEVALYRDPDFLAQKKLDLLVISHFDSDHVNHLHRLLNDGIKIKRLVMPLITFEERLFLVLNLLGEQGGYGDGDDDNDFSIRITLDPLTTLAENFDDNGFEAFIIQSDPDKPIGGADGPDNNERILEEEERLTFDFPGYAKQNVAANKDLVIPPVLQGQVKVVKDSTPGHASTPSLKLYLMDFLFYRKSFGEKETAFYAHVKSAFLRWKEIDETLPPEQLTAAIYESIKTIKSATNIKEIFKDAAAAACITAAGGADITDPNTTALCLLHRNLDLLSYAAGQRFDHSPYYESSYPTFGQIQKFSAGRSSRIRTNEDTSAYYWHHGAHRIDRQVFPNTMLTSDTFLLAAEDVQAFMYKYQRYYPEFWLMQIPHHGSQENSNAILHAQIPGSRRTFINYGTQNTHKHPSDSVILSLVASGLSPNLIPVNEYQGYEFSLEINLQYR